MKLHVHDRVQWCDGSDEVDWLGPTVISLLPCWLQLPSVSIVNSSPILRGMFSLPLCHVAALTNHRDFPPISIVITPPRGLCLGEGWPLFRPLLLALKCEI